MAKKNDGRYKGKVGISAYKGRLRLSLPRQAMGGKQKFIYLGLNDSPENRKLAQAKAWLIESDIRYERFDQTLKKYLPQSVSPVEKFPPLTLLEIYKRYVEARRAAVRPGTWRNGYKVMIGHLERSPFARSLITDSVLGQKLLDWSRTNLTADTAQRFCTQLNAAIKWAIDLGLIQIEKSPFEGLAKKLKASKGEIEIYPFSRSDSENIIGYFTVHYSHYSDFIKFLFWTGCRPSEALALKWEDVATDFSKIIFTSAIVAGDGGLVEIEGLKTQKKRSFPCNDRLRDILKARFSQSNKGYVFTGQGKDTPLNLGYIRKLWRKCLEKLGIQYRKIYQCRHTFITLCLGSGMAVQDVARLVGNSPEIIYRHYAGISKVEIPEF